MKKILILPFLLLAATVSNAQLFTIFGKEVGFIYVGPKVGTNFSSVSNWTEYTGVENKHRVGYQFGAVGEFGFTNRFSVESELMFFSKGMTQDFSDGAKNSLRANYVSIPLLAKMAFNFLGLKKVYFAGGSYQNIRTGGSWLYTQPTGQTQESDLGSGFKTFDWGLSLGAGAEYPTKYGIWGLDLRYDFGITALHVDDISNEKSRNRSLGISLTYKFDIVDLLFKSKNKSNDQTK